MIVDAYNQFIRGYIVDPSKNPNGSPIGGIRTFINIFNKFYAESGDNKLKDDKELVKYFKSEFGNEWKIELDKYLIRTEYDIDKKAA